MLFNSIQFLVFFPLVVSLYFLLNQKYRWVLLLAASYYFYMVWKPGYIILIVLSTVVDYLCGIKMGAIEEQKKRLPYLYISLIANLGLLFTFKYFNFAYKSVSVASDFIGLGSLPQIAQLLLPVGISFYTFQTMSYSIDIYYGKLKPEKHPGVFALFVTFFPQLVAGPIERAKNLLPQFWQNYNFNYNRVREGMFIMLIGFFKKVVIADNIAPIVDRIYSHPSEHTGLSLIITTVLFTIQIYCDFSGYSDIAIGGAKVMGFDLMKNFKSPYFSKSITEHWRRWHISLSTWFRDYVYVPLGGNRVVKWRWYYNLFLTFLISGLWHGANWTYVIWGGLHGVYMMVEAFIRLPRLKTAWAVHPVGDFFIRWFNIIKMFTFINIGFVIFRSKSISDSLVVFKNMTVGLVGDVRDYIWLTKSALVAGDGIGVAYIFNHTAKMIGSSEYKVILITFSILFLFLLEYIFRKTDMEKAILRSPFYVRWPMYVVIMMAIILLGNFFTDGQFIYFQF